MFEKHAKHQRARLGAWGLATICLNLCLLVEATCAKTLVWSFLLCFLVMTVWSMLMVEMVHPLLKTLPLECKGCDRAMSSATWQNWKYRSPKCCCAVVLLKFYQGEEGLKKKVKESVRICQNLSESVRICQNLSESVRICQNLSESVRICQNLSESVRICQNLSESVRICHIVYAEMLRFRYWTCIYLYIILSHGTGECTKWENALGEWRFRRKMPRS